MNRSSVIEFICKEKITAVIRLDDLSTFQLLAKTLIAGGVRSLEFTLTNCDALHAVEQLRGALPVFDAGDAIIGIGSIRSEEQTRQAIDAGAQLLVSPVLLPQMIALANQHDVVCAPGAYTPTEIETAWQTGADFVKVFPANTLGPAYIKAVLAPMPDVRLMPTGGIDLGNVADYLRAGCAAVGIGRALDRKSVV